MKKGILLKGLTLASLILSTQIVTAQEIVWNLASPLPSTDIELPPMNEIYHPVSTKLPEAQKSFDKGLTYIFAFNHDLAFHEFKKAAELDPKLAMAYWGMALALGQNINSNVTPENELRCYAYIQKALNLSTEASVSDQQYIKALAVRYTNDPHADLISLRFRYREAMKNLVKEYPEDLDAASLYAESILDLDPWKWWTLDGKPKEGIQEAIDVLESVLLRNPDHIGANHYYVHALEESPYPERALMSAHRLTTLLANSGHLLHMPCHIFLLVGDYENAVKTSKKAITEDLAYFQKFGLKQGTYPLHYLSHNYSVLARTYMLLEDSKNAIETAFELTKFIEPHISLMPHLAVFYKVPLEIYLYFRKWKEILAYPLPSKYPPIEAYWHCSRAIASASLGNLEDAKKEKELMLKAKSGISEDEEISNNPAKKIIDLAEIFLDAAIAQAENKSAETITLLKKADKLQDTFFYDEPPAWFMPAGQKLGFALLREKRYEEAEKAFRKTLLKLKRNGRSLFGLSLSLKKLGRNVDAFWIEREAKAALKHASEPLEANDL